MPEPEDLVTLPVSYNSPKHLQALARHDTAVERNNHVKHGVKTSLVQQSPTVIVLHQCACGRSYTVKDGLFNTGDEMFYELMEHQYRKMIDDMVDES